ncbi:MAG: cupin domain-containing protein [Myxococcales bacterium]|jgi:uncharacterized RmlC-like cupin family protein
MTTLQEIAAVITADPAESPSAPPAIASDAITVIAPDQRAVTPCSSVVGLLREACVDQGDVWMGMVSAEPGTASVWHDHGERTTYLLPISGEGAYLEYEGGERIPLRADGTVYVTPAHLRHREVNAGSIRMQAFLIRLGPKAEGVTE